MRAPTLGIEAPRRPGQWHPNRLTWRSTEVIRLVSFRDCVILGPYRRMIMDKRTLSIVGAVGILCLEGFALAPAQSMPLADGISAIHQTATGNDPARSSRQKGGRQEEAGEAEKGRQRWRHRWGRERNGWRHRWGWERIGNGNGWWRRLLTSDQATVSAAVG
jgi:hypothetical protein